MEALYEKDGMYYDAKITKVHPDGYYDVEFEEDHIHQERLPPSSIQHHRDETTPVCILSKLLLLNI